MSGSISAPVWLRITTLAVSVLPLRLNSVTSALIPVQLVSWLARLAPAGAPAVLVVAPPAGAAVAAGAGAAGSVAGVALLAGGVASVVAAGSSRPQAAANSKTAERVTKVLRFMAVPPDLMRNGCVSPAWRRSCHNADCISARPHPTPLLQARDEVGSLDMFSLRLLQRERRHPDAFQAGGVEPVAGAFLDELPLDLIDTWIVAAVAAEGNDHLQRAGEMAGRTPGEVGGRHRIALAADEEHRHVGADRLAVLRLDAGVRPRRAGRHLLAHAVVAEEAAGRARRDLRGIDERDVLGAGDGKEHSVSQLADDAEAGGYGGLADRREVAGRRLVNQPRQPGAIRGVVDQPAEAVRHDLPRQPHLDPLASPRVPDLHRRRALRQPSEDRRELLPGIGEPGVAGRVALAPAEQQIERTLATRGVGDRQRLVHRHDADEQRRAHRLRMTPQVDLGRAGAVGAAGEVDRPVAQPGTHLVEVVHGEIRGVEREVVALLELLAAFADRRDGEHLAE